ncbi:hypothetical protein ABKN59_010574 [Abortiporus biennis]
MARTTAKKWLRDEKGHFISSTDSASQADDEHSSDEDLSLSSMISSVSSLSPSPAESLVISSSTLPKLYLPRALSSHIPSPLSQYPPITAPLFQNQTSNLPLHQFDEMATSDSVKEFEGDHADEDPQQFLKQLEHSFTETNTDKFKVQCFRTFAKSGSMAEKWFDALKD